jgi:hypothetical protein
MKSDRGMGTLMTVFSGIAALMCLLVGLQLLFLQSQIGQAVDPGLADPDQQFRQWKALAHTGAVMSLGAGVLIFLFGLHHLTTTGQARKNRLQKEDPVSSTADLESVSVRVFEVDAEDRSVEITPHTDDRPLHESRPRSPVSPPPVDQEPDQEPQADPTDSIVRSIRAAAVPDSGRSTFPCATGFSLPSYLCRLFGRRPRR